MFRSEFVLPLMKMQAWQRAKGELNAMADAQFQMNNGALNLDQQKYETDRWLDLKKRIEEFVKSIEDDALNE